MSEIIELKEAVELLEDGFDITLESDTHFYEVYQIGGHTEDGYMSNLLGDITYYDAETVLKETIERLNDMREDFIITY